MNLQVISHSDRMVTFQVFVDDKCAGELQLEREQFSRFAQKLLGNYKLVEVESEKIEKNYGE